MKKRYLILLSLLTLPTTGNAQCFRNGILCSGPTPPTTPTSPSEVSNGSTVMMGTNNHDRTRTVPVLTNPDGEIIVAIDTMPALPSGTNIIGGISSISTPVSVTQNGSWNVGVTGPVSVTGIFYQPIQPVSQSGSWTTSLTGTLPAFSTTPTFNLGSSPVITTNSQGIVVATPTTIPNGNTRALSLTTLGYLRTDASATVQPISISNGADVATGATTDTAYTGSGFGSVISVLKGIHNLGAAPTPAGTNLIGKIAIDQTTSGVSNGVIVNGGSLTANIGTTNGLATDTSVLSLFKAGQSIGNSGFNALGSAGTAFQQGTGVAGVNAMNVVIGGQNSPLNVSATFANGSTINTTNTGVFAVQNTSPIPTGSNTIGAVNVNGTVPTSVAALPLPAGAATSALQSTISDKLSTITTNTTGVATATNQVTMSNQLTTIINNQTNGSQKFTSQTPSLTSLLLGKSFTTSFPNGALNAPNGSFSCILIRNPTTDTRGIWEARILSTDVSSGRPPARYYVINNPTGTLPATVGAVATRGTTGVSTMVVTYGVLSALPTGIANGGYVPTGGAAFNLPLERTIEPLSSQIHCISGVNPDGALGTTSNPSIVLGWREQSVTQ